MPMMPAAINKEDGLKNYETNIYKLQSVYQI